MSPETALANLRDAVALWYVAEGSAATIVRAACDLLVTGSDGLSLCLLAAASIRNADEEVPPLLEAALHDVGLAYYPPESTAAAEAGIRTMAERTLSGSLTPSALAQWVLPTFGYDCPDLARGLADLAYAYDQLEDRQDVTAAQLDAEVLAEARAILATTPPTPAQEPHASDLG